MASERIIIARTQAELPASGYAVAIKAGRHDLTADESSANGGGDAGPAPYDLLLSALAACTAITLRMYATRKGWDLAGLHLDLRYSRGGDQARIDRTLVVKGGLSEEQKARLAEIAERTPVTLTLKTGVEIRTELH
jgi:putative redox protein